MDVDTAGWGVAGSDWAVGSGFESTGWGNTQGASTGVSEATTVSGWGGVADNGWGAVGSGEDSGWGASGWGAAAAGSASAWGSQGTGASSAWGGPPSPVVQPQASGSGGWGGVVGSETNENGWVVDRDMRASPVPSEAHVPVDQQGGSRHSNESSIPPTSPTLNLPESPATGNAPPDQGDLRIQTTGLGAGPGSDIPESAHPNKLLSQSEIYSRTIRHVIILFREFY
jgi:hypothetical protein